MPEKNEAKLFAQSYLDLFFLLLLFFCSHARRRHLKKRSLLYRETKKLTNIVSQPHPESKPSDALNAHEIFDKKIRKIDSSKKWY